jgi:uncharacterized protein YqgV (UPF0045/DUF77 family)
MSAQDKINDAVAHIAAARTNLAAGPSRAVCEGAVEILNAAVGELNEALADPEFDQPVTDVPVEAPVEPAPEPAPVEPAP